MNAEQVGLHGHRHVADAAVRVARVPATGCMGFTYFAAVIASIFNAAMAFRTIRVANAV